MERSKIISSTDTELEIEKPSSIASRINELHARTVQHCESALMTAGQACQSAIECGEQLIKAKKQNRGEFGLWLRCWCPTISERTARNYMQVAKYRQSLAESSVDFKTLKELYVASGILPPPSMTNHGSHTDGCINFWTMTKKIENWLPRLPEHHKPRLHDWWEQLGRNYGWL